MRVIDDIKELARTYGACNKVESINSIADAVGLLLTPQGREFALKTGFPTYEVWREVWDLLPADEEPRINGIHILVDSVRMIMHNEDAIVVGLSKLLVDFNRPDKLHHVIAMHGAEVEIQASNHSVITVTNVGAKVSVINDGSAIVNIEKR